MPNHLSDEQVYSLYKLKFIYFILNLKEYNNKFQELSLISVLLNDLFSYLSINIKKNMEKQGCQFLISQLISNQTFIEKLANAVQNKLFLRNIQQAQLSQINASIVDLLDEVITCKIENQVSELIQQNNQILARIEYSMKKQHCSDQLSSLRNIEKIIQEEKNKILQEYSQNQLQRSISAKVQEKYVSFGENLSHLTKKVRHLQEKFETNLKGIWNVITMTESALFDHIKDCQQQNKIKHFYIQKVQKKKQNVQSSIFNRLWKQ